MNNIEKEYLILGVSYIHQFSEENNISTKKYKDLYDLYDMTKTKMSKETKGNPDISMKYVNSIIDKITSITGTEIVANALALALSCFAILLDRDCFKGSSGMKFKRLFWSVYNELEKSQGNKDEFRNSLILVSKIEDINENLC